MNSPIQVETRGAVLVVTLNRPTANAIDVLTSRLMGETFAEFRDDPALRVAIITGAGDKFFCAGWDLKAAAQGEAADSDYGVGGFGGLQELPDLNKPVIAAVNGICCGGGLELALSADLILASEHATFALPEINSGTIADAATLKLPRRVPYHVAMELLLTGRWMDASEAHHWGLINEMLPKDQLIERANELADTLADGPPLVYAAIKEVLRESEELGFQRALDQITGRKIPSIDRLYSSDDQLEGARAFSEKRKPLWRGR
jgi:crotonobetainyl-CoA hydratase